MNSNITQHFYLTRQNPALNTQNLRSSVHGSVYGFKYSLWLAKLLTLVTYFPSGTSYESKTRAKKLILCTWELYYVPFRLSLVLKNVLISMKNPLTYQITYEIIPHKILKSRTFNPHQNDQGRKGPCYFQRLIALKCLNCQKIKKKYIILVF